MKIGAVLLLLVLSAFAVYEGLQLRDYAWRHTDGVRFTGDVANGFSWGQSARRAGLFYVYDQAAGSNLDYTPLRLTVVYFWASWAAKHYPQFPGWQNDYDLTAPMLWYNTASELASAVLIFLLIRLWTVRTARADAAPRSEPSGVYWGLVCLALGGLMRWFTADAWASWSFLFMALIAIVVLESIWSWFIAQTNQFDRRAIRVVGALLLATVFMIFDPSGWGTVGVATPLSVDAPALTLVGLSYVIQDLPLMLALPLIGSIFLGAGPACLGALFFWFNPAVIWDGHCWPQWDIWLVPFFLGAVLLASVNWFFLAGVLITIGGNLKGQMWLGAPILLAWPLCQLRFGAALRAVSGLIFAMAFIALPWMHPRFSAMIWYLCVVASMGLLVPFVFRWKWPALLTVICALAAVLLAWPWSSDVSLEWKLTAVAVLPMVAMTRFLQPTLRPSVFALGVGVILLMLMPMYRASSAWWDIGFAGGAERYHHMVSGNGTFNLPALLPRLTGGWPQTVNEDFVDMWLIGRTGYRDFAILLYGTCVLLCGVGAAINARRNDRRFLVAMAAPWILFYIIMPQMHGRYLLWGGAISALLAAESVGVGLIGLLVGIIAALGMITNQYRWEPSWDPPNWQRLSVINPYIGWMLILLGAIVLYIALVPRTLRRLRPIDAELPIANPALTS